MLGEHYTLDRDLLETQPWEDNRTSEDQHQPERCCVHNCLAERLARLLVILDEEDDLQRESTEIYSHER